MKVSKKQSKRQPLRHKYKVERKVREHNRKIRKEARLNPQKNKKKKDPGIPNLWPFKEQMLERIKAQQEREKDNKARQKEIRAQNQAKNLRELMRETQKKQKTFEEKEKTLRNVADMDFNRLPDNSKRQYYREFKKVVEASDVILEVLDARDPMGTRATSVEQMITSQANKKIILVLNKIDLVPREIVQGWLKHLRKEYPTIAFKCCTTAQRTHLGQSSSQSTSALSSNECLGAPNLIQLLKNYSRSSDIKTSISVGIIGYPNVGKSSLINSLNRSKAVGVGATPGFTKVMQEVQLDKKVKLLDCPGIVFASGTEADQGEIMLRNCVRVEKIEDPIKPIEAILRRCKPSQLMTKYKIPIYNSSQEFLSHVARRRGKLLKGGVPDYVDAARIILQDWNSGFLPYFTIPPKEETKTSVANASHESAAIVSSFAEEFDLDALLQEGDQSLNVLPSIYSAPEDQFVEISSGASLDKLFSAKLSLSDEQKEELSDDEDDQSDDDQMDDEESDDQSEEMDSDDESSMQDVVPSKSVSKPSVRKIVDEEDQYNPQRNANIRKQMKKNKKAAKKQRAVISESFDFENDFVADNDNIEDVDDDDLINF